ncbi:MAG TPA: 4Fe-4S binding protein [Peptococcaceae bacterium]|nr:4Fe-4S binding protein [Peptococcaceae bacterium]
MRRKIIEINEEKCNGCGLCVNACHEGALELVNGKAKLVSDEYCDGLGNCLPECPTGAIKIIEREAAAYNDELVQARLKSLNKANEPKDEQPVNKVRTITGGAAHSSGCACPGTRAAMLKQMPATPQKESAKEVERPSELRQWPVQLTLINPQASYLQNADLLIAADCTAYAYASFHEKFMKDRITLIGCPKLDDLEYYTEKIAEIIKFNNPTSVKVVRMEVPCCTGIARAVKDAMLLAQTVVPYSEIIINAQGQIIKEI